MDTKTIKLLIMTDMHHCSRTPKIAYSNAIDFAKKNHTDYILFLGDFSDIGDSKFKKEIFESISTTEGGPPKIGCPGNHDVDRKKVSDRIKKIHKNLDSGKRLNRYQERLFTDPIKQSGHFSETITLMNEVCVNTFQNAFWSIHKDTLNNVQFISLNSAYFCGFTGFPDLVGVPEQVLATLESTLTPDFTNIVLLHHPIEKFHNTDKLPLKRVFESFCARNADFVIFGDEHYQLSGATETGANKYYVLKSLPFAARKAPYNGMTLLELPKDNPQQFRLTHFENKISDFPVLTSLGQNGFHFPDDQTQKRWEHLDSDPSLRIRSLQPEQIDEVRDEISAMICPDIVRTKKAISDFNVAQLDDTGGPTIFSYEVVAQSLVDKMATAVMSPKDTGLTTLGHQVAQKLVSGLTDHCLLPCYIDCTELIGGNRNQLIRRIHQGCPLESLSKTDITTLFNRNQLALIFDRITDETRPIIGWLNSILPEGSHRLFLLTENTTQSYKIEEDKLQNIEADEAFIMWPLDMKQIKSFVKEFYPGQNQAFIESRMDKIVEAFKILNEPRYPALVENVLHVLNRDPDFKFTSKYEAIGKSIDARLGRRQDVFTADVSVIDYETKRLMLGYVCAEILKRDLHEFDDDDWCAWMEQFGLDRGLPLEATKLLNEFMDVGILIQRTGHSITFRSDYIFYYFISIWMYENDEFYEHLLSSKNIYKYHEAVLYFIADKAKHKVDILSVLKERLDEVYQSIHSHYQALDVSIEKGMANLQTSIVQSYSSKKASGYVSDAEELIERDLVEADKAIAAEKAVEGVGTHFGLTRKPDIRANEARFLALLRTYARSLRFVGNRTDEYKQKHLKTLFDHAWTLANIIANKKEHLLNSDFYLDEGIAYLNFSSDTDDEHPETELFYKIQNSITFNVTNFAASSQLVQSLAKIDLPQNQFMAHWKRSFSLSTCDQSLFPEFLREWKSDTNIYTRFQAAGDVVRLAKRHAYDDRKFQALKDLNREVVKEIKKLKPGLIGGQKVGTSATKAEKREYLLLFRKLANFSVTYDDE
jgi:Icc-related predicted phosphoesterase